MMAFTIIGITFSWFLPRAIAVFALYIVCVILFFKFKPKSKEKKDIKLDDDEPTTEDRIARLNALEANAYDNVDTISVDDGYLKNEQNSHENEADAEPEPESVEEQEGDEAESEGEEDLPENTETVQNSEVDEMEANFAKIADEDCMKTQPVSSDVFENVEGFVSETEENEESDLGNVPNVVPQLIDLGDNTTDEPQNEGNFEEGFGDIGATLKLYQQEARQLLSKAMDEIEEEENASEADNNAEEAPYQPEPDEE